MPAGRPRTYTSPDELQEAVDNYFKEIQDKKEPATITGLALYLGFASKQSLYDYEENELFTYPIKRARLMIEYEYEKKLSGQAVTGSIFALKNMGWEDKTKTDLNGQMGVIWNEVKNYGTNEKADHSH